MCIRGAKRLKFEFVAEEQAAFFDAAQHLELLARLAANRLSRSANDSAHGFIDRRCRLIVPSARDLFLRALTHRANGRLEDARRDLARAAELDPTEPLAILASLYWGEETGRLEAAERLVAEGEAPAAAHLEAVRILFSAGAPNRAHAQAPRGGEVFGWICWASGRALAVRALAAQSAGTFVVNPDPKHALAAPGISAANFVLREGTLAASLELTLDGEVVTTVTPTIPLRSGSAAALEPPRPPTRLS